MDAQEKSPFPAELLLEVLEEELKTAEARDAAIVEAIERALATGVLTSGQKRALQRLTKVQRKCRKRVRKMRRKMRKLRARL
jgi:hypothetical protein